MKKNGVVVWLTGLSGAGKSTIAEQLVEFLKENQANFESLDGDVVRAVFQQTGFTRKERIDHLKKMGFIASLLEKHGVIVVASFVSPYRESRDLIRKMCSNFIEIYVSTPLHVCETRDVKGLYKKARKGEIDNFTGISDPYEPPLQPEISIDTSQVPISEAVKKIISCLKEKGFL